MPVQVASVVTCSPGWNVLTSVSFDGAQSRFDHSRVLSSEYTSAASTAAPTSRWHATRPMLVTTMVNFGWSPTTYCGWLVMPLTDSVESGQASTSFRHRGGRGA